MCNADLPLYQGDDFNAVVAVTDAVGAPSDLTGFTARAQIRRHAADQEATVAVEIGTVIVSPNVYLSIPGATTQTLTGRYVWDLQLTSPAGAVITIMGGKVIVSAEVTREVVYG